VNLQFLTSEGRLLKGFIIVTPRHMTSSYITLVKPLNTTAKQANNGL